MDTAGATSAATTAHASISPSIRSSRRRVFAVTQAEGGASGDIAGCVNPAAVGGESAELTPYFPADASASVLSTLGVGGGSGGWLPGTDITTPFVTLPGLGSGKCASQGAFTDLSVTVNADPSDPRADDIGGDLTPEWGLHLIDVSIVMGDIVERVRDQAAAYTG
jgi:hypothetical protein